jgi:NADH:ubiquinone oxidoreductase subunit F (NADH-binding)
VATKDRKRARPRPHWLLEGPVAASYADYLEWAQGSASLRALELGPARVMDRLEAAGLRGRGGAGFPTARKWRTVASHACPTRYVVCNAAEGEPGTFKDRWLLRHNPFAVLEGMLVAAHTIGAKAIYVAIKSSFVHEEEALRRAIEELRRVGRVDDVPIRIVRGPDEYLFGEEKALLNVIEGEGPLPREADEPPYEVGLYARPGSPNPALVNNVQTFAHVSTIVNHDGFRDLGTEDTPGTILVTLSGYVRRPGVYEIEAGLPLRTLITRHGGGFAGDAQAELVLAGVSAPPIEARHFDVLLEFGALQALGSGLGSAGFIVIDPKVSRLWVARGIARFLYVESCNQCSACKAGLGLASDAIESMLSQGVADPALLERATIAAHGAPQGNRCYLPVQGAALIPRLLQGAKLAGLPWSVPKMVDFDERTRRFTYDESQERKRPDWTYERRL